MKPFLDKKKKKKKKMSTFEEYGAFNYSIFPSTKKP